MTADDLIRIVQTGAGLAFDADGRTKEDLIQIVSAAQKADTVVTLKNVGDRTADELVEIASAGKDSIYFEL